MNMLTVKLRTVIHQKIPENRFKNWETQPKGLSSRLYKELLWVSEKTANNPIGKGYEREFLKRGNDKYIKRCSIYQRSGKIQIKTTMR